MDKVLAFSILSASPADIAAGVGGSWTRLSWRRSAENQASKARQHQRDNKGSRSHDDREGSNHAPRFAPEFDGIDCFETIVTH